MDFKNTLALRKKMELLGSVNKRKMSLRKNLDNLKQNECTLEITQITKCVFLGSLCLKPVPQLFDSPLLLEELDTTVGNARTNTRVRESYVASAETIKRGNSTVSNTLNSNLINEKRNHMTKWKRKSSKDKTDRTILPSCEDIKNEKIELEMDNEVIELEVTNESLELEVNNESIGFDIGNEMQFNEEEILSLPPPVLFRQEDNGCTELERVPLDSAPNITSAEEGVIDQKNVKIIQSVNANYPTEGTEDLKTQHDQNNTQSPPLLSERNSNVDNPEIISFHPLEINVKREPTPELVLSDSDEDAIDQLMYNIMDIKVGPHVFESKFIDIPPTEEIQYENNTSDKDPIVESQKLDDDSISRDERTAKRRPQCKICSQMFRSYIHLKKHRAEHEGEKPYICVRCCNSYSTLDQLIAHLRIHQGKRPYVCKKCNEGFKTMRALENHQPVHVLRKDVTPKKTFKCEICGKEFRKLCDLERHTRVHTGEKPSVCNICNRRFQQAYNLNKHLLIHTQEKPFHCDICNKKFGRNDVLNRHLLTHSVKKPNKCQVCRKTFIRISQLQSHMEKCHGK